MVITAVESGFSEKDENTNSTNRQTNHKKQRERDFVSIRTTKNGQETFQRKRIQKVRKNYDAELLEVPDDYLEKPEKSTEIVDLDGILSDDQEKELELLESSKKASRKMRIDMAKTRNFYTNEENRSAAMAIKKSIGKTQDYGSDIEIDNFSDDNSSYMSDDFIVVGDEKIPVTIDATGAIKKKLNIKGSKTGSDDDKKPKNLSQILAILDQKENHLNKKIEDMEAEAYRLNQLKAKYDPENVSTENLDYKFTQELKFYCLDLLEMIEVKKEQISNLQHKYLTHKSNSCKLRKNCRRKEIKLLNETCSSSSSSTASSYKSLNIEHLQKYRLEKTLNKQLGKLKKNFPDGYSSVDSSDDEEILVDDVFEDVEEKYKNSENVIKFFENWRNKSSSSYVQCYGADCLGKILPIFINFEFILRDFDPFKSGKGDSEDDFLTKIFETKTFKQICNYSTSKNSTRNVDKNLLNVVSTRVILPYLSSFIEYSFDPLSSSKTNKIISILKDLCFLPCLRQKNGKQMVELVKQICEKFDEAVEKDGFIPTNPTIITSNKDFLYRQIWRNIKVLDNLLRFSGFISAKFIKNTGISNILNRNLMIGLSAAQTECGNKQIIRMAVIKLKTLLKSRKVDGEYYEFGSIDLNRLSTVEMFFKRFDPMNSF